LLFAGQTPVRRRNGDQRINTSEGVGARQVLCVHVRQEQQGVQIKSAPIPVLHLRRTAVSIFENITQILTLFGF